MIDYEERLRRLQCLANATDNVTEAEMYFQDYSAMGIPEYEMNDAAAPFAGWSHDGEINVIYDRNGRVDHVTVIDDERAA